MLGHGSGRHMHNRALSARTGVATLEVGPEGAARREVGERSRMSHHRPWPAGKIGEHGWAFGAFHDQLLRSQHLVDGGNGRSAGAGMRHHRSLSRLVPDVWYAMSRVELAAGSADLQAAIRTRSATVPAVSPPATKFAPPHTGVPRLARTCFGDRVRDRKARR